MTLGINNAKIDACAMGRFGVLHEHAIESVSGPNGATVHAVAAWAVVEHREDIADALRSDTDCTSQVSGGKSADSCRRKQQL